MTPGGSLRWFQGLGLEPWREGGMTWKSSRSYFHKKLCETQVTSVLLRG